MVRKEEAFVHSIYSRFERLGLRTEKTVTHIRSFQWLAPWFFTQHVQTCAERTTPYIGGMTVSTTQHNVQGYGLVVPQQRYAVPVKGHLDAHHTISDVDTVNSCANHTTTPYIRGIAVSTGYRMKSFI